MRDWGRADLTEIARRLAHLAVLRILQLHRETDINRLREHLQPTRKAEPKLTSLLSRYKKVGGVTGTPGGYDEATGYSYKLWQVADVGAIRQVNREECLPLMPPSGKEAILWRARA